MSKGKRLIVTLMSSGMATAMSFVVSFFLCYKVYCDGIP